MAVTGLEIENLRREVSALKDEARKNERAWRRAQAIELELLEADQLGVLLNRLTQGLRSAYRLDLVTVALIDGNRQVRHLLTSQDEQPVAMAEVRFVESPTGLTPQLERLARPWLGPFDADVHGHLFAGRTDLASVALLPLVRGGRLVGSLNLGSCDAARFTGTLATDFLYHLGVIAAFALENSINHARLLRSGFTDVLTGWHNRRYLQMRLREELARSSREQTSLVCLMLDIDHFKQINDSFGHAAGDEVLCWLARRVKGMVRSSDVCVRYGGEEFIILLPGTDGDAGRLLAERIRCSVSESPVPLRSAEAATAVSVSIGVAQYRPQSRESSLDEVGERLIARADAALYEAKAQGRNKVVMDA